MSGFVLLSLAVLLLGCTPGSFSQASSGWSPAAAVVVPVKTGETINEGATFGELDNVLTVTFAVVFSVNQVIQIDDEQLIITSIIDRDLRVTRGANGTAARSHADQSDIYTLGDEWVVFVTTKQGEIKALRDDGSPSREVKWTFVPNESDR